MRGVQPVGGIRRYRELQLLLHVRVLSSVERFDIELFPDFSAKWANFAGLALFCIDAKFCKKIFVGKLLTRSTRFTCFCAAQTSIFQQKIVEKGEREKSCYIFSKFCKHFGLLNSKFVIFFAFLGNFLNKTLFFIIFQTTSSKLFNVCADSCWNFTNNGN